MTKTSFSTPHGVYQFDTFPFGLLSAPATFQHLPEKIPCLHNTAWIMWSSISSPERILWKSECLPLIKKEKVIFTLGGVVANVEKHSFIFCLLACVTAITLLANKKNLFPKTPFKICAQHYKTYRYIHWYLSVYTEREREREENPLVGTKISTLSGLSAACSQFQTPQLGLVQHSCDWGSLYSFAHSHLFILVKEKEDKRRHV